MGGVSVNVDDGRVHSLTQFCQMTPSEYYTLVNHGVNAQNIHTHEERKV